MESRPNVSIVIPAYNAEAYIENCIVSIQSQSYQDFEIIVVDDGSSDRTPNLIDASVLRDHRIRAYHKQNGGASSARRFGIEHAKGHWILFVDSDDTMSSDAIKDLLEHDDGNSDIIAGTILYKTLNRVIKTQTDLPYINRYQYIRLLLARETYFGPCSKLIKRTLFDGLKWNDDPRIFQNEDLLMLILLSEKTNQHISISNDYVHYICEFKEGSMSTRRMSYEGWKLLFCELREVLLNISDSTAQLFSSYVNYAIRNIYECLLLKSINIPQDAFLEKLIEDTQKTTVLEMNVKALSLLTSPVHRWLFCKYRWLRMSTKHILGKNVM